MPSGVVISLRAPHPLAAGRDVLRRDRGGPGQPGASPARQALSPGAAAGRRHAEPRADRAQQGVLAPDAVPGLQGGAAVAQGDPLPAVGPANRNGAAQGAVEIRPAGLLHAAVRTTADDDALPDGDPAAAAAEA